MKQGLIVINSFSNIPSYLYNIERLKEEFLMLGVNLLVKRSEDLILSINDDGNIDKLKDQVDFAIFFDKDKYLARPLEKLGIKLFNNAEAIEVCDDKYLTHLALVNKGIKMPKTIPSLLCYTKDAKISEKFIKYIKDNFSFPLILKECHGSLGKNVYLVEDEKTLLEYLEKFKYTPYLIQEMINTSVGKDIRVIMVGDQVVASMYRENKSDFRSNINHGGKGYKYEINEKIIGICKEISSILSLDYCGIDLLFGENEDEYYLCEVNSNAFFKEIERVSDVNVASIYASYIYKKVYLDN